MFEVLKRHREPLITEAPLPGSNTNVLDFSMPSNRSFTDSSIHPYLYPPKELFLPLLDYEDSPPFLGNLIFNVVNSR